MVSLPSPPNIVLVIMDDLGWGDLGCHGNPIVHTPTLDALHDESTRLTRYCSGPLCTPARASLMTGRYHLRTRAIDTYCGRSMIDPDEVTIARALRPSGYRTGAFGKWHLGDCHPMRACDMGFDTSLVHQSGGIGWPGDDIDNFTRGASSYFDPVLYRDGIPERTHGYCTDIFTSEAIRFVEEHRAEPFFCYLATNAPHTPLEVGDEWVEPYRRAGVNETHARLYGMVENVDWNVGRLLATLQRLGIADDTIVIYTSDHGPCPTARDLTAAPDAQQRYNAGLRGEKGSLYEGGIKVPFFWRWPSASTVGLDVDRVASPIDVLPTLCAATSTPPPPVPLDGWNLLPLLTGAADHQSWPDREIFMQWHRGDVPVRHKNYAVISQRYKLYRPGGAEDTNAGATNSHVAPQVVDTSVQVDELYDLDSDPGEQHSVAHENPGVVLSLRLRYEQWFDDMSRTRVDTFAPSTIHLADPGQGTTTLSRQDWRLDGPGDGFGSATPAHWEVVVTSAGRFDFEVTMDGIVPGSAPTPASTGTLNLRVGSTHLTAAMVLWCTRYAFPDVELAAGEYKVSSWAEDSTGKQSAMYVRATRVTRTQPTALTRT